MAGNNCPCKKNSIDTFKKSKIHIYCVSGAGSDDCSWPTGSVPVDPWIYDGAFLRIIFFAPAKCLQPQFHQHIYDLLFPVWSQLLVHADEDRG